MAKILFKKGSYAEYKALTTKDAGTIYFCEDTLQIFQGANPYTQLIRSGTGAPTMDAPANSLYIDTAAYGLYLHNGTAWEKKASLLDNVQVSGTGNVITGFTFTNGVLTLNKTITAATTGELGAVEKKIDDHTSAVNPHGITPAGIGAYTKEETEGKIAEMMTEAGAHTHDNKTVLDGITEQKVTDWDDAVAKEHTHDNKDELDKIVIGDKAKWDTAAGKAHEHDNKAELDKIAVGDKAKWDAEIGAKEAAAAAMAEAQKKISGVKEGEKVISVEGTELTTTLVLSYSEEDKKIKLLGVGDAVVAELDATAFIKDGMLSGATYDNVNDKLVLSFNTDAGKEDIEVPLSDLVYSAGNGINITDNKISVVIDPATESFLTVGAAGVKLSGVQTAIDHAKQEAIEDAEGKVSAEKTRAEGVESGLNTRLETVEGNIGEGTVDSRIATAKQEAITAAGTAADKKIEDLNLGTMSQKNAADYDTSSQVDTKVSTAKQEAITAAGNAADQKIADLNLGTMSQKDANDYDTSAQVDAKIEAAALTWGSIAE